MPLTPIAPFPCGICGASPRKRERLRDGFELCRTCGFAIRLDARGELIAWATTNVSHPHSDRRGWLRHAPSLLLLALLTACAPATATVPGRPTAPRQGVLLGEDLPDDYYVCVPRSLGIPRPYACMVLRDLRVLLRTTRLATDTLAVEARP